MSSSMTEPALAGPRRMCSAAGARSLSPASQSHGALESQCRGVPSCSPALVEVASRSPSLAPRMRTPQCYRPHLLPAAKPGHLQLHLGELLAAAPLACRRDATTKHRFRPTAPWEPPSAWAWLPHSSQKKAAAAARTTHSYTEIVTSRFQSLSNFGLLKHMSS